MLSKTAKDDVKQFYDNIYHFDESGEKLRTYDFPLETFNFLDELPAKIKLLLAWYMSKIDNYEYKPKYYEESLSDYPFSHTINFIIEANAPIKKFILTLVFDK